MNNEIIEKTEFYFEYARSLRRDFHRHPELGFQETRTSGVIARELGQLGLEVTTGIAKTGVVGLLEGEMPGPTILLRFDMDALPVTEETGADYASESAGVMHACGHDGHMAAGITIARILSECRERMKGRVKFIFQPAEEGLGGAALMIQEGVLESPSPDYALAFHLWNGRPVGWLGITSGPIMAGAEIFNIRITGQGGHGAIPDQTIDPIVVAAHLITVLQTITSRNVSPLQSAVLSVTCMQAGDTYNIIPQQVELRGTIRVFEKSVRELVVGRMRQICAGIAQSFNCQIELDVQGLTPPVVNDSRVTQAVEKATLKLYPTIGIDWQFRTMVSEDMAFFLENIPGCYVMVGSANPEKGLCYGHHHPRFDFDEQALGYAVAIMTGAVFELMGI
ncbi:MAG: amidohydrolase [Anaerolineales bacterium]